MNTSVSSTTKRILKKLGVSFLEGLIAIVPIGTTILILGWIFNALDGFLQPVVTYFVGRPIPGAGFGALLVLIVLAGVLASNLLGRWFIGRIESALPWLPGVRQIYTGIKQILVSFSRPRKSGFKRVVLLEFPRKGILTIGFITGEMVIESGKTLYTVFVPQSPLPTAGFVEIVSEDEITSTDLSVEDALRTVVSMGRMFPQGAFNSIGNIK